MIHPQAGGLGHYGFGVEGDAHAGGGEHGEVIGAIADREGGGELEVAGGGELLERGEFRGAVQDRLGHLAGEGGTVVEQGVGAVFVEAAESGHAGGEEGEAAGDKGRGGVVRAHGGDQGAGAGGEANSGPGAFEGGEFQATEEGHALTQGVGEIDLAVHGATGDGGDLGAQSGFGGEVVQGLAGDDGAVHVGDEEALAAAAAVDGEGVDGGGGEGGAHGGHVGSDGAGDVNRFAG